jgi:hypothetical protein
MDQTQAIRAMRSFHLPVVCKEKKKKNTKGCFCKT